MSAISCFGLEAIHCVSARQVDLATAAELIQISNIEKVGFSVEERRRYRARDGTASTVLWHRWRQSEVKQVLPAVQILLGTELPPI